MANPEHLEILKRGVGPWNLWRTWSSEIQPDLSQVQFQDVNLSQINLSQANLREAIFIGIDLSEADLHEATLCKTVFAFANLSRANLNQAKLIEADISSANLRGAKLHKADLFKAVACYGNKEPTVFREAELNEANLSEANLFNSNFSESSLYKANFSQAILIGVDFNYAYLKEADFSQATIGHTIFTDVDLSRIKGLETVRHQGPSSIGIDTVYRSQGNIPEAFLHGAGVDDTFISYITALTNKPIQYYSCFISHSSKDEVFAKRLFADLQQSNVRCWFASEDMRIGDEIRPSIDVAIRIRDKLLLILSEYSINSWWVKKEVETAFEEEAKRDKTILFPIRLDEAVMETDQAWAADIRRTRHIGDFSQWKNHDHYKQAFERLLHGLKVAG